MLPIQSRADQVDRQVLSSWR